jgi:hypothetical protein
MTLDEQIFVGRAVGFRDIHSHIQRCCIAISSNGATYLLGPGGFNEGEPKSALLHNPVDRLLYRDASTVSHFIHSFSTVKPWG